ncbi:4-sulfomuconolactone hydrolase [Pigmentiphaga humi]|uniref:4-sulfomuconolactone hydrolase n=2 Tax=Pigmentiphaga humi TaxID=2478468 RepID=A0A3P4B6H2_9BURK|nr:amidohydrolase family protein [Pigmentiphaga humi]VCU71887.1 4-sulfomuconolactone hydrolase [Pigmentiphaga humi]
MPDCAPPLDTITPPAEALPANACDSHFHVFGPAAAFPYAEDRPYTPPDAPFDRLRALHRQLGFRRGVIVHPGCHGYDLSVTLDALDRGAGQYRAVALLASDADEARIAELDRRGVRGVRFNFVAHLANAGWDELAAIAPRIAPFGWHLCIHSDQASLAGLLPRLKALSMPFVIDHMGRIPAAAGTAGADFQALLALRDHPGAWVKISGLDRSSSTGKRPYADAEPLVAALIAAMPDRLLWGTDWPHPNVRGDMPDDGELLNTFLRLCPDPATRRRILADNPDRLFRFQP